jgi:hypothetical protein
MSDTVLCVSLLRSGLARGGPRGYAFIGALLAMAVLVPTAAFDVKTSWHHTSRQGERFNSPARCSGATYSAPSRHRRCVLAAMIGADMTEANTVYPAGVPSSRSWYAGPEIKAGNTPPAGYDSMTAWGTVYPASTGTSDTNTRVELRDEETWVYSKSQAKWDEIQSSVAPNGSLYYENLSGNATVPANLRTEPDGGVSVKMVPGYTFQFFPQGSRPTIDPGDIGGVITTVQARLVVDNPALPNDTADAHYIVDSGGDYWLSPTAPYPNNAEIFTSRYDTISTSWTTVSASTLTASQLSENLPAIG